MTVVLNNDMLISWNSVNEQDGQYGIYFLLLQTFEYQHSINIFASVVSIHPQLVKEIRFKNYHLQSLSVRVSDS